MGRANRRTTDGSRCSDTGDRERDECVSQATCLQLHLLLTGPEPWYPLQRSATLQPENDSILLFYQHRATRSKPHTYLILVFHSNDMAAVIETFQRLSVTSLKQTGADPVSTRREIQKSLQQYSRLVDFRRTHYFPNMAASVWVCSALRITLGGAASLRTTVGAVQMSHLVCRTSAGSLQRRPEFLLNPSATWQQSRHGSFFNKPGLGNSRPGGPVSCNF
ncbi:hypothetical protein CCH79_00015826 [Gambusia affinis]|uniref:Uncharacterized protein n=1 Tax=Gambusia affinis TaxID=33528 RepID=A0A315UP67_GAMAF|nr:hypothetical protein CCH79_00015826 [Gambusia affinis]